MGMNKKQSLPWERVWITGASQGIGQALALALAKQGVTVAASARNQEALAALERQASALPGEIMAFPVDVTNRQAVGQTVANIESSLGAIDLAILNAGTFIPMDASEFDCDTLSRQLTLNVMGAGHCIEPLVPRFLARKQGHLAMNASLAGYRGLPRSGAYGASKAALINLAESMYLDFLPHGIKVQVINPGFVKTPLTDKNTFPMPFLVSAEQAAEAMIKGLSSEHFEIRFPRLFSSMLGTLRHLPYRLYFALIRRLT